MNYKRLVNYLNNDSNDEINWECKKVGLGISFFKKNEYVFRISKLEHKMLFNPELDIKLSGYELYQLTTFAQCNDWYDNLEVATDNNGHSFNSKLYNYLVVHDIGPLDFCNITQVSPNCVMDLLLFRSDMTEDEYNSLKRQVDLYI